MKHDLYYAIDEQTPEDQLPACADLSCMNSATWVWVMEEDQVGDEPFTFKGMFVCSTRLDSPRLAYLQRTLRLAISHARMLSYL